MKTNLKISVIIPVYNVEQYIEKCVFSVLNQTYKNIEIILVDDGSKDESGRICDGLARLNENIIVIHKENGGLSSARNAGIDVATGEYLGFVDSDDYIDPNMYEELYQGICSTKALVATCGLYKEYADGVVVPIGNTDIPSCFSDVEAIEQVLQDGAINVSVCCKLFHKSIFDTLRFPEGKVNEDEAIIIDTLKGQKVYHTGTIRYHYVFRSESITNQYGAKGAYALYQNMEHVYQQVLGSYPIIEDFANKYKAKKLFDILMIYNVFGLKKDDLYIKVKILYNQYWKTLVSCKERTFKENALVFLEKYNLLKPILRIKRWLKKGM